MELLNLISRETLGSKFLAQLLCVSDEMQKKISDMLMLTHTVCNLRIEPSFRHSG